MGGLGNGGAQALNLATYSVFGLRDAWPLVLMHHCSKQYRLDSFPQECPAESIVQVLPVSPENPESPVTEPPCDHWPQALEGVTAVPSVLVPVQTKSN